MKDYQNYNIYIGAIILLVLFSCKKTISVQLEWGTIETPKNVEAGLPITSKVQLMYSTTSYPINFQGFRTVEKSKNHFLIAAPATIITHGAGSVNAMEWIMDTTYVLLTTSSGQYILDFVFKGNVMQSDTVDVR
ncbi:hypothetical protein QTN47_23015 [Danxiaibacter flavus]|uniref:Uncharacterized protein n=1 Tax=Danxiaibacter flavus TaxID=3049108 RepID=A0ABV3ZKI7_9BACT|nr:hypothetical protein QNM32_23020 [Chitinophagaceae bacterium DXS]